MGGRKGMRTGGHNAKPLATLLKTSRFAPGTRGDRKEAEAEVATSKTSPLPSAPEWLTPFAREEWDRLVGNLHERGLLDARAVSVFASYCEAVATLRKSLAAMKVAVESAQEALEIPPPPPSRKTRKLEKLEYARMRARARETIASEGEIVNGHRNPNSVIASKARDQIRSFAVEFGLSASTAARIFFNNKGEKDNPDRRDFPIGLDDANSEGA